MTPDELEILEKKEFALYTEEVGSAIEAKLHLVLAHLYIEHLLERYISTKLKTTGGLFGQYGLTFDKKVCLAESCGGLNPQSIAGVRRLNALRNDCVHKFKHQPTEKQIHDFGRSLGKAYQETIKSQRARATDLSLLRLFCARLCGAMLAAVLKAEHPRV